jgi:type IV pilus assembly protein PilC
MGAFTYTYQARDTDGRMVRGNVRADSRIDAYQILRDQGRHAYDIQQHTGHFLFFQRRTDVFQRIAFFRSLANLMRVGVDINRSFEILKDQATGTMGEFQLRLPWKERQRKKFAQTIRGLHADQTENGLRLHEAMANRSEDFTELECAMVNAGEHSGKVPQVLAMLADFLERDREQNRKLFLALLYPAIVSVMAVSVVVFLSLTIIPEFATFYQQMHIPIPLIMQYMLRVAGIVHSPIGLSIIFGWLIVGGYFLIQTLKTERGAMAFDHLRLRMPIFGNLIVKSTTVRFSRVMAMLLNAGVNMLDCFEVAIPVVNSPVFAQALVRAKNDLQAGRRSSLADTLKHSNLFEPMFVGFLNVGEEIGDLPGMFEAVATYYADDVATIIESIPSTLQTLVTLLLGAIVGLIAYAVYVPLTNLAVHIH